MKEFLSSPAFLWGSIVLMVIAGVIALLWRNTVWEARGITPEEDVERLRTRMTGLFPKSPKGWFILAGVIILIAIGFWWLSGTSGTPSVSETETTSWKAPSLATVVSAARDYWLWILILWGVAVVLVAVFCTGMVAKTLQWVLAGVVFTLFIGLPVVDWIYGDDEPVKPTRVLTRVPQDDLPQVRDVGGNVTDPATWPKLYLSIAEPKSALLPMAPGKRIVMAAVKGTKFKSHTVYRDGHECVSTKGSACPDGGVVGAYATNEGDVDIIVSYAYDSLKNKPL